jgi:DNA-binding MarR family transcriptional regulator
VNDTAGPASRYRQRSDSVGRILDDWARLRPELDFAPVGVFTRLNRLRSVFDAELTAFFRNFGLSSSDFAVLANLRRAGEPHVLSQSALMSELRLTSGTISVRVDRLERLGLVRRMADPDDGRGVLVEMTALGAAKFDEVAPLHLANEARLLSALDPDDLARMSELLARLLGSFEHDCSILDPALGLQVAPAHEALLKRADAGLSERVGLLVTSVVAGRAADAARLRRGDLLVAADGRALRTISDLDIAVRDSAGDRVHIEHLRGERRRTAVLDLPHRKGGRHGV